MWHACTRDIHPPNNGRNQASTGPNAVLNNEPESIKPVKGPLKNIHRPRLSTKSTISLQMRCIFFNNIGRQKEQKYN